ncbi:MAG: peptidase and in kexin sedolisin [Phycisphaerales bacterium]|nr:peptidase and in kexin sedolisin [Phycisphaerales bacterium]
MRINKERVLRQEVSSTAIRKRRAVLAAAVEALEQRQLLSAVIHPSHNRDTIIHPGVWWQRSHQQQVTPFTVGGTASPNGFTPSQIKKAYGIDQIGFGTTANGNGQTIAIVDAYNDPNIASDLLNFDAQFGLPNPTLTILNQTGTSTLPTNAAIDTGAGGWAEEISLDVEWAHALAPGASIVLVETNSASRSDMYTGVRTAAGLSGVSVVSMSWGAAEYSGETADDSNFTSPVGHAVTFIAATGDAGSPAVYPAASPNVLAVGGTTLTLDGSNNWSSESTWSSTGGGSSAYENLPSYQTGFTTSKRGTPDVAFDANPTTGVPIYDSYDTTVHAPLQPWLQIGGTSFSAPAWGALIAITNQGRVLAGFGSLDGPTQTLPNIYALPSSDFHDITSGGNGTHNAASGYDLVTGRGTPIANKLVPDLVGVLTTSGGTLNVAVTGGNDTVSMSVTGSVFTATVNSLTQTFSNSAITGISVPASAGDDTITLAGSVTQNATLFGGDGNDSITGGSGNDAIDGGNGHDTLNGGAGNDGLAGDAGNDQLNGGTGSDNLSGGTGIDSLVYSYETSSINVTLDGLVNDGAAGENDNVNQDVEIIYASNFGSTIDASAVAYPVTLLGGTGNDTLIGGASDDSLVGGAGNDQLWGNNGNDTLDGGDGNDALHGGGGNDLIIENPAGVGQTNSDDIHGDTGTDTVSYQGYVNTAVFAGLNDVADDGAAGEGQNVHSDIEIMYVSNGNCILDGRGAPGPVTLVGGNGNDTLYASNGGGSVLYGGGGTNTFNALNGHVDTLNGNGHTMLGSWDTGTVVDVINP